MSTLLEESLAMMNSLVQSAEPVPTTTEDVQIPVVAVETPVVDVVTTPVVDAPVVTQTEPLIIDNWDVVDSTPVTTPVVPTFDFATIGKDLGFEAKTREELVAQVNAIKTQAAQLKQEKEALMTNVPQDLVKAIELSRTGGDYLGYLGIGAVDYSKADPIELYETFVENSLTDPKTGVTDWDKVNAHLDKLDDADLEIRGRQIQVQYVNYQNAQRSEKEQQIQAARLDQERSIRQAVDRLEKVGDFKVSPTHKQEVYQDLLVDPLKDYRKGNGQFDYEKLARDRFIIKNYEKLDKFRQQQIKNAAKREILNDITNPELTKPGALPTAAAKKGYSLDDLLNDVSRVK